MLSFMLLLIPLLGLQTFAQEDPIPGYPKYSDFKGSYQVTYDNRSILIDGKHSFFASVGIHYPRFTPGQWDDVLAKAKKDGYNMIQTYFFHNAHQPKLGVWPWNQQGSSNLTLFLEKARDAGFFVDLRIGPYVCAEWSWGGLPYNIGQIPGLVSRTSSIPWKKYMSDVFLNVTREFRDFYADKGGPIILGQVENELHTQDQAYVEFCGNLVNEAKIPIPWIMCNGNSSNNTINTCNSNDCTNFINSHGQSGRVLVDMPALWTEDWMGAPDTWGKNRPAGLWPDFDSTSFAKLKSYLILRWVARGGSHVNQYNWAGGNNFARNAGSDIVNMYYWQAPIASDNLDQGNEREHIARTFTAVASVANVIFGSPAQANKQQKVTGYTNSTRGQYCCAFVYPSKDGADEDVVFLENSGGTDAIYTWNNVNVTMPAESVAILEGSSVIFSSSDVTDNFKRRQWIKVTSPKGLSWSTVQDSAIVGSRDKIPADSPPYTPWRENTLGRVVSSTLPLEAVNFTEYDSELCFYYQTISTQQLRDVVKDYGIDGTRNKVTVPLTISTATAQAWLAFVDGTLAGTSVQAQHGSELLQQTIQLNVTSIVLSDLYKGKIGEPLDDHTLTLVSSSLGVDNSVKARVDNSNPSKSISTAVKGIVSQEKGSVMLGKQDITQSNNPWVQQSGSTGEKLGFGDGTHGGDMKPLDEESTMPMSWLQTTFSAPPMVFEKFNNEHNVSLSLDITGLSRGRFYVNGFDLGRYWTINCGNEMCQRYYPIPFDILKPGNNANTLVLLDELGAARVSSVGIVLSSNTQPECNLPLNNGGVFMMSCGHEPYPAISVNENGQSARLLLQGVNKQLCLGSKQDSNVAWQNCNNQSNQEWTLKGEVVMQNGKCLEVQGGNAALGTPVVLSSCTFAPEQLWSFVEGKFLVSHLNEQCLGYCSLSEGSLASEKPSPKS
eukprot:m.89973 g.89973  ORF g.89973 m.89973 type:complete len:945 (-) comp13249_c0_seq1:184-3018(-)